MPAHDGRMTVQLSRNAGLHNPRPVASSKKATNETVNEFRNALLLH